MTKLLVNVDLGLRRIRICKFEFAQNFKRRFLGFLCNCLVCVIMAVFWASSFTVRSKSWPGHTFRCFWTRPLLEASLPPVAKHMSTHCAALPATVSGRSVFEKDRQITENRSSAAAASAAKDSSDFIILLNGCSTSKSSGDQSFYGCSIMVSMTPCLSALWIGFGLEVFAITPLREQEANLKCRVNLESREAVESALSIVKLPRCASRRRNLQASKAMNTRTSTQQQCIAHRARFAVLANRV